MNKPGPNTRPMTGTAKKFNTNQVDLSHGVVRADIRVGDTFTGDYSDEVPHVALNHGYARRHSDTTVHCFKASSANFHKTFMQLRSEELIEIIGLLPINEQLKILEAVSTQCAARIDDDEIEDICSTVEHKSIALRQEHQK